MSADSETRKRSTLVLILWLAAAAVAIVVVLAVGTFLVPYLSAPPPQDHLSRILIEPPPPPPPPPPASSSPLPPAKISSVHPASQPSAHPKKIVLSAAVAKRLLIQNPIPIYPPIARAARISGTVVLHAVISTSGSVKDLSVISGPAMLQQSALDAVKTWKYRPYLLNDQPLEFETTINVIYTLGD